MVVVQNRRKHLWMPLDEQNGGFETTQEFMTQTELLLFIPDKGIGHVLSGLGDETGFFTLETQESTS